MTRLRQLSAAIALHFIIFAALLLPLHAQFCGTTHGERFSHFAGPENHGGLDNHNPDHCQLCKTHGQLDILPFALASQDDTPERIVPTAVNHVRVGSFLLTVNALRGPPLLS